VTASFFSISTYAATLGQIPTVIRERDPRYINLPMVAVSIVNSFIWTGYSVLKRDIPLFMTNSLAFFFMTINLIFYMWAIEMISTESIQSLINFSKAIFPAFEDEPLEDDEVIKDLDADDLEGNELTKAEV